MTREKEYNDVHNWLRDNYGRASACESPTCAQTSRLFDWALKVSYEYSRNRDAFQQLCRRCHAIYDREFNNLNRHDKRFVLIRVLPETARRLKIRAAKENKPIWKVVEELSHLNH